MIRLHVDDATIHAPAGVPSSWILEAVRAIGQQSERRRVVDGPEGERVFVKVYRRRPSHGLLRRLSASRAIPEGRGYVTFHARELSAPQLRFFGEVRRWGLLQYGFIATEFVDRPNVAQRFKETRQVEEIVAVGRSLAAIHASQLHHGDPVVRNFLVDETAPVPIDLSNWGKLTSKSRREDLVRLLGSAVDLSQDRTVATSVLDAYRESLPSDHWTERDVDISMQRIDRFIADKEEKRRRKAARRQPKHPQSQSSSS